MAHTAAITPAAAHAHAAAGRTQRHLGGQRVEIVHVGTCRLVRDEGNASSRRRRLRKIRDCSSRSSARGSRKCRRTKRLHGRGSMGIGCLRHKLPSWRPSQRKRSRRRRTATLLSIDAATDAAAKPGSKLSRLRASQIKWPVLFRCATLLLRLLRIDTWHTRRRIVDNADLRRGQINRQDLLRFTKRGRCIRSRKPARTSNTQHLP